MTTSPSRLLRALTVPLLSLLFLVAALPTPPSAAADGGKYGNARLDQWTWTTTHNSYAHDPVKLLPPRNQSRSIAQQLDDGVRGLMLDTYDKTVSPPYPGDAVMLCHSKFMCYDFFQSEFARIVDFLQSNRHEVVTIFLENYAARETLTKAMGDVLRSKNAEGLLFSPDAYRITENNWPLLRTMDADNRRLVVFQDSWQEDVPVGSGSLMYTWSHTVENKYGYGSGNPPTGCAPRNDNALNTKTMPNMGKLTPLFTMNHFNSDQFEPNRVAPNENAQLKSRIEKECRPAAGRNPNYVAVNFYQESANPGLTPLEVVAELNRNAWIAPVHPAVWTVTPAKQYVSAYAPNRCMVRGEEFETGGGGVVTQRACAEPAPSSHQWTAARPPYDHKGYFWIRAGNGSCLTVPYNNGTPPGDGTQMFWWPCETRWSSGSQLWNVVPVNLDGRGTGYYFVNQWTGRCLTLDPSTTGAKAGKVTQAACPR
ncbi:RICIN domain-containing protein [Streptomyces sp. NPDC090077]|uniref:RICIN domain-containing protein n=1 Tax=Streptomyces sp. NPDC090077 TaxID=3365938 RepID=UPI0038090421